MKVVKVKKHTAKKKSGGLKNVRTHVRKTKTAAEKPSAGKQMKKANPDAKPPKASTVKTTTFKSPMHARMAALRAMRNKHK